MKSKVKYAILAAIALIVIGCSIVGIGKSLGGSMVWSFSKTSSKGDNGSKVNLIVPSNKIVSDTISLDPFDELEIKNISVNCIIERGDDYKLEYSVIESKKPKYEQKGSSLVISEPKVTFATTFYWDSASDYYKLTIPENAKIDANIENTSGDIRITSLKLSGKATTVSGEIYLSELIGDDLTANTTSGDFSITGCTYDTLSISTISGNADASCIKVNEFKNHSTSGDLLIAESTVNSVEFSSVSGIVRIDSTSLEQFSASTTSGDVVVSPDSIEKLKCKTISGEVYLSLPDYEDKYDLDISCTSGDIVINGDDHDHKYRSKNSGKNIDVETTSGDVFVYFR